MPGTRPGMTILRSRAPSGKTALQIRRAERIAGRDLSAVEARLEPALALRRCAMGEAVRHHRASRLPLQAVVADRRRGLQCRLDVAGLQEIVLRIRVLGPHTGIAIRLQFDANLNLVCGSPPARR